jgi:hypothetical protein
VNFATQQAFYTILVHINNEEKAVIKVTLKRDLFSGKGYYLKIHNTKRKLIC